MGGGSVLKKRLKGNKTRCPQRLHPHGRTSYFWPALHFLILSLFPYMPTIIRGKNAAAAATPNHTPLPKGSELSEQPEGLGCCLVTWRKVGPVSLFP